MFDGRKFVVVSKSDIANATGFSAELIDSYAESASNYIEAIDLYASNSFYEFHGFTELGVIFKRVDPL